MVGTLLNSCELILLRQLHQQPGQASSFSSYWHCAEPSWLPCWKRPGRTPFWMVRTKIFPFSLVQSFFFSSMIFWTHVFDKFPLSSDDELLISSLNSLCSLLNLLYFSLLFDLLYHLSPNNLSHTWWRWPTRTRWRRPPADRVNSWWLSAPYGHTWHACGTWGDLPPEPFRS